MASDFDFENIDISKIVEGLTAVMVAPVILPAAAAVNQPMVKAAIKEGIAFSERCQEAVAEARERLEDIVAEAQAELSAERESGATTETTPTPSSYSYRRHVSEGRSRAAGEIMHAVSELNAQVGWLTNGMADLRMLMPLGLGALAIRQLFVKGIQLDEIPWYTLAWYSFDSFSKLNRDEQPFPNPPSAQSGETPLSHRLPPAEEG